MKKIIDLSISLENDLPSDPKPAIPKITYMDHKAGAKQMTMFFPDINPEKDLPEGKGWAIELMTLSTHSGTHLDAPWHYHDTMSKGRKALTIDEIPLEWCIGNGVKLDFRDFEDGRLVTPQDIEDKLKEINYEIRPNDIVLINTGADKYWGSEEYLIKGCGMGKEATLYLLEKGVHVVGTDAWSWDRPLSLIAKEFAKTKDSSIIWEGHFAGIEKGYCHIEKLTNLDKLPVCGFTVSCLPIKIKSASGGWVRAVAILDE